MQRLSATWKKNFWHSLQIVLLLFSFGVALYLAIVEVFIGIPPSCNTGSMCSVVLNSEFKYFCGIPITFLGTLTLFVVLILAFLRKRSERLALYGDGALLFLFIFSLYFISLQEFVIKAWCRYCLSFEIPAILAVFFRAWEIKKEKIYQGKGQKKFLKVCGIVLILAFLGITFHILDSCFFKISLPFLSLVN